MAADFVIAINNEAEIVIMPEDDEVTGKYFFTLAVIDIYDQRLSIETDMEVTVVEPVSYTDSISKTVQENSAVIEDSVYKWLASWTSGGGSAGNKEGGGS
jgi:hypothetical protein